MAPTVTLAYSNHRAETLRHAEPLMLEHDAVVLEEPPTTGFRAMCTSALEIDDYLEHVDFEYPELARRSCALYRRLDARRISIYQSDPYMELLGRIHDLFDAGGSPRQVADDPDLGPILTTERAWTAALVAFYRQALAAPFEEVVSSVTAFARTDAARGRLRDALRAQSLLSLVPEHESIYVEAGTLHLALLQNLLNLLPTGVRLRVRHLMRPVVRTLGGRSRGLGPGDLLTLLLTVHPELADTTVEVLAARSLVYNRIVHHEEMVPGDDPHPHTRDEVEAAGLVERLELDDCRDLYRQVKTMPRPEARILVRNYLAH